jgi:hypothetical protein
MRAAFLWTCLSAALLLPPVAAQASTTLRFSLSPPPLEQGLFLIARADQAAPDFLAAADSEPQQSQVYSPGNSTLGSPPAGGDWAGLGRDTAYLIGYQALAFAILYVAPESVSNWSEESKHNYDFQRWVDNVTHPQVDSDKDYINYVLHPYWGSAYFLDARGRGFGRWGSFLFSFFCSCLYEFGTEAFAEPVSVQDFFVTPMVGSLLGIGLEGAWSHLRAKGESRNWGESVLLVLIDPLGQTNSAVDSLFGFKRPPPVVRLLPVIGPAPGGGTYAGVQLSMQW